MATATVPGDDVIDVTIAVGPDGTCACKVRTADGDGASASPDVRAFEEILAGRLAEAGCPHRCRPWLTAACGPLPTGTTLTMRNTGTAALASGGDVHYGKNRWGLPRAHGTGDGREGSPSGAGALPAGCDTVSPDSLAAGVRAGAPCDGG